MAHPKASTTRNPIEPGRADAALTVLASQAVFDVYLGLTASGYDLANPARAGLIVEAIRARDWPPSVVSFYAGARIDDGRVNPYWPRGSVLAGLALLAERAAFDFEPQPTAEYLAQLTNVAPDERNGERASWYAALPCHMAALRASTGYGEAFSTYTEAIRREQKQYRTSFMERLGQALGALRALLPAHQTRMLAVVNPLQADPLTDVVKTKNLVCVIASRLRVESCVHELVHQALAEPLATWAPLIEANADLLDAVFEPMARASYAWDRSEASWSNVFAENLVRAITAWLVNELDGQVTELEREGFAFVRPILQCLDQGDCLEPLSETWLLSCLGACREFVDRRG